jgi:hypothetical protein
MPAVITTTHVWRGDSPKSFYNAKSTTVGANLCVVLDATNAYVGGMPCGMIPTTSLDMTIATFLGVSKDATATLRHGAAFCTPGDVVMVICSGTVTTNDLVLIDSASGKEGRIKTTAGTVTTATTPVKIIGTALETGADGDIIAVRLNVGL